MYAADDWRRPGPLKVTVGSEGRWWRQDVKQVDEQQAEKPGLEPRSLRSPSLVLPVRRDIACPQVPDPKCLS